MSHRKMPRRSRDHNQRTTESSSSTNNPSFSGFDLYTVQGNAESALDLIHKEQEGNNNNDDSNTNTSFAYKYNCQLLAQIVRSNSDSNNNNNNKDNLGGDADNNNDPSAGGGGVPFLKQLEDLEQEFIVSSQQHGVASGSRSAAHLMATKGNKKQERNGLILAYNRALVLLGMGQIHECANLCANKLTPLFEDSSRSSIKKPAPGSSSSSGGGTAATTTTSSGSGVVDKGVFMVASRLALVLLDCILTYAVGRNPGLDSITEDLLSIPYHASDIVDWLESSHGKYYKNTSTDDPQLLFMLSIYKSRLALADVTDAGKKQEHQVRAARKEIKTAMEVFQHKLRNAENGSVVSSANSEEGNLSKGGDSHSLHLYGQPQQSPPNSVVLQKLHQSALSLKSHLEGLKGNTKKSLILSSEAYFATPSSTGDDTEAYEVLHDNNLAVVYETNQRRHLALYALSKSLRRDSLLEQQQQQRQGDHEQQQRLSPPLHRDGTVRPDPTLSILHNTSFCALRAKKYLTSYECMAICISKSPVFRQRALCWLRLAESCLGIYSKLSSSKTCASSKRLSAISKDGEPKGLVVDPAFFQDGHVTHEPLATLGTPEDLEQVQRNPLLRARTALEEHVIDKLDAGDALVSARLSLTYVYLAFGDYVDALRLAKAVLDALESSEIPRRKRQRATAKMYAAEACCKLGVDNAMNYLDDLDRLASDLSGVTLETASNSDVCKRRLAKSQAMVRASAAMVSDKTNLAKQLANSANAIASAAGEEKCLTVSRRALVYALLREGNGNHQQSSALTMLLSLR